MFFDDDFCLCGNAKECPKKNECRRAETKVGIHTYSNFYDKNNNECKYYLKRSDN